jgi:hypothetical protein
MLAASEPASGSVSASAAIVRPEASSGSQRLFCASEPSSSMAFEPMCALMPDR